MSLCIIFHTIIDEFCLLWRGVFSRRWGLSLLFSCNTTGFQIKLNSGASLLPSSLIYQLHKKINQVQRSPSLPLLIFWGPFFSPPSSPASFCVSNVTVTFDLRPVTSMTESTWGSKNKVLGLCCSSELQLNCSFRQKYECHVSFQD